MSRTYENVAYYEDKLKKPEIKGKRFAVVMCTYVSEVFGDNHRDDIDSQEKVFKDVKFTLACHKKFRKSTVPYDLFIVDNSSPYKPWLKEIKKYEHETRENTGFSFGAYKYFWDKYGNNYDYILFHEQDVAPCKKGWLDELFYKFHLYTYVGAVGMNVMFDKEIYPEDGKKEIHYLCGAFYFTSKKVLNECELPIEYGKGFDSGTYNEMHFVQGMLEKGYKIVGYNYPGRVYSFGRNIIEGDIKSPNLKNIISPMISINSRDKKLDNIIEYLNENK
jgi:hypothetical protein